MQNNYQLVRLANGTHSVYSEAEDETFHPVIGPVAEARSLYVNQLKLAQRAAQHVGEFVLWDVGLGAAANVLTVFESTRDIACNLRILSFDHTIEPLKFALQHAHELGYIEPYQTQIKDFLANGKTSFQSGEQTIHWEMHPGDFPTLIAGATATTFPAPHAIIFDAYSPAKNPAMWTAPLFGRLYQLLDSTRPCAMPTYSRSTMLRVTLLLAGFYVGVGHATGEKEETTLAANSLDLLDEPLPQEWLKRARASKSAEPMWEPTYRQAPISEASWQRLLAHPQFQCK